MSTSRTPSSSARDVHLDEKHSHSSEQEYLSGSENDDSTDDGNDLEENDQVVKPLTKEDLEEFNAAQERTGVVYISRIPPGMRPAKVRHLMSAYGEVGRVFLQQEDPKRAYLRKKYTSTKKAHYTEGWVEFKDKKVARSVANMLNAQAIGGKKGTRWRDDVWTLKYLPRFKWFMLTEQIAHEAAIHKARLRVELSQSRSEQHEYLKNVELARVLDKRAERKRKASDGSEEPPHPPAKRMAFEPKKMAKPMKPLQTNWARATVVRQNLQLRAERWQGNRFPRPTQSPNGRQQTVCKTNTVPFFEYQEPARRSSRSRSPRRRDRDGGHPEAAHDHSSTHSGYGQDRGWDDYYDRRGRGRSRSPGDESGRKRRRSHSPYERDRFEPRPRYGDDYDAHSRSHGYSSPRSRNGTHYPPYQQHSPTMSRSNNRPPPMDPYLYQPQAANLRQYAEWFRATYPKEAKEEDEADRVAEKEAGRKTRDGIRARWEKYKKKHLSIQLQTLFDHHKGSPWFSEKYNPAPEWVNLRNRVRKQGWKGRPEMFLKELEEGKFDQKREFETTVGKDNTVPTDEKAQPEDVDVPDEEGAEPGIETQIKNETNGKPSIQNGRQTREDDVSVQPDGNQIAIRTIPPDIGRQKIEEACQSIPGFVHLALGDPLQKRQYYRAGWLKFDIDDADVNDTITLIGEKKIDGFKLHVSHVSQPYYGRLRQAPTTPQRIEKDLQQVKQLASILEDEYAMLQAMKSGAPEPKPEEPKKEGEQDASMSEGQQLVSTTNEAENTEPEQDVDIEPAERGSEAVERRIEKLAVDLLTQQDGGEGDGSDSNFELNKSILALDLYVAYIRAAYNTCYYCAAVCDHVEELNRKCPKHVRKMILDKLYPGADETADHKDDEDRLMKDPPKEKDRKEKNDDIRKMEMLDSKIALLINRSGIDPVEYGGKNPDEELRKAVEPHIKQEDEGKFRCRTCTKLFKASSFVEKHILNKHGELVKQLDELPFFNNFALDPNRVQPFTHLPPAVGNNIPNPQAYGLQAPPPAPYPMDYGRPPVPGFYGGYPPPPPGAYPPYGAPPLYEYYLPGNHWQPPQGQRKDDHAPSGGRRLQERMGGYASTTHLTLTGVEGLPPKPVAAIESSSHEIGGGGGGGGERIGGGGGGGGGGRRRGRASTGGPPPPPPADAKEDPRAAAGRKVSYHDMDDVAEGDVELTY